MPDPDQHRLTITEFDVIAAIKASAPGSAAGLDGFWIYLTKVGSKDPGQTHVFRPFQLGVSVCMDCEAAVHTVRDYSDAHTDSLGQIIVKLDLTNILNIVHRSATLCEVIGHFPSAAPLVSPAYSQLLHFGSTRLWSCRGVQHGEPLGPILFALALNPAIEHLPSPLNFWFLDDGTLAGPKDVSLLTCTD
ncbi:hypothetical protein E2C01_044317 [Portunus trituberculatus]|uniref:Reverse transcriptase domain-containing protein n=1 Tax=Portunus trituberculatus TaxID=210409 RepID=A0A5B7FYZ8_PORTR|nr:hypothetical protein [Portunus trituberculatus]